MKSFGKPAMDSKPVGWDTVECGTLPTQQEVIDANKARKEAKDLENWRLAQEYNDTWS